MSGETNVRDFGATGDGDTDDSSAIQAALDATANGGRVFFPLGIYRITVTLNVSGKGLTLAGEGWTTHALNGGPNSNSRGFIPLLGGSVVYQSQLNADAIDFDPGSNDKGNSLNFEDIAFLGPGEGTGTGINMSTEAANYSNMGMWKEVGIFNFPLGVHLLNVEDYSFVHLVLINNITGFKIDNAANQDVFFNLVCDGDVHCGVIDGAMTDVFVGGLVQGSALTSGVVFDIANCDSCRIEGIHFENALSHGADTLLVNNCKSCTVADSRFTTGQGVAIHLLPGAHQTNLMSNAIWGPLVVERGATGIASENILGQGTTNQSSGSFLISDHTGVSLPCFRVSELPAGKPPGFQACVRDWAGPQGRRGLDRAPYVNVCRGGGTTYAIALFDGNNWSCR